MPEPLLLDRFIPRYDHSVVYSRGGIPPLLAIVPVLWGFIGGSAAVLLDVPTDYVLLAGGALLTFAVLTRRGQDGGPSPRNSRRSQP
jgi:hypothetical protein